MQRRGREVPVRGEVQMSRLRRLDSNSFFLRILLAERRQDTSAFDVLLERVSDRDDFLPSCVELIPIP